MQAFLCFDLLIVFPKYQPDIANVQLNRQLLVAKPVLICGRLLSGCCERDSDVWPIHSPDSS